MYKNNNVTCMSDCYLQIYATAHHHDSNYEPDILMYDDKYDLLPLLIIATRLRAETRHQWQIQPSSEVSFLQLFLHVKVVC